MKRGSWGTRFGFYLAAIGSAFGLGNLWRFPYVVAENGGGAFVLFYVFLAFIVGMPILLAELLLGKHSRKSVISAVRSLPNDSPAERKAFSQMGYLAVGLCTVVLAYYAVISGWVLHYLIQFLLGKYFYGDIGPQQLLLALRENGWLQVLLVSVHLLAVVIIVAKDVEQGIERWVGYMMPPFVILLGILVYNSLTLESSKEALRFLFYPDFSQLKLSALGHALGHVFFTLSVGFGTMVTFGSYLKERSYIPIAGFRVTTMDTFISLFAGLLIFPLVMETGIEMRGPDLFFQAVPGLLESIPGGWLFGVGFFLCLYLASLGASIGLLETVVANSMEVKKLKRSSAAWLAGVFCFVIALFPALSTTVLSGVQYQGRGLLELLDSALINWVLPIAALALSQIVAYKVDEKVKQEQFLDEDYQTTLHLYNHWKFALKYLTPALIIIGLILQTMEAFS